MTTLEPVLPHPQLAVLLAACQLEAWGEEISVYRISDLCGIGTMDANEAIAELRINGYLTLRPAWRVRLVKEKTA